jgi:MFS family permease
VSAWVFLGLFGVFLGIQGVVFNFLVSKVVPVRVRGRLMGLRNALSGLTATAVAIFAGAVLIEDDVLGNGYAATFLLAFALTSVGLLMLLFVREPETPHVRAQTGVFDRLRDLPSLLRADRDFTRYFAARALAVMGRMAVPLYIIYAGTRMEIGGAELGHLTGAFIFAQSVGNLGWGAIADRLGFRLVFLAALAVWMLAAVALIYTSQYAVLLGVFAAIGLGLGGFQMSAQSLVLEFGSRQNLPMRIAVANSASELVAAVGSLAGGVLAVAVGQVPVIWAAVACQAVAFTLVCVGVKEPRGREADRMSQTRPSRRFEQSRPGPAPRISARGGAAGPGTADNRTLFDSLLEQGVCQPKGGRAGCHRNPLPAVRIRESLRMGEEAARRQERAASDTIRVTCATPRGRIAAGA